MAKTRRARGSRKASRKAEKSSRKAGCKTMKGGKRAPSEWNKAVQRVYNEMKRKDRSASFSDALKEASKRKKAGNL